MAADEAGYPGVFGATVDTGWWGTQGYDASLAIEELADRTTHVHLKDVRAVSEPHETCRWGDGIVPIERCVRTLQRLRLRGRDRRWSTSRRRSTRPTTSARCARSSSSGSPERRARRRREHRGAVCGVHRRSTALAFVGATDLVAGRAAELPSAHGGRAYGSLDECSPMTRSTSSST